jgi:hypothetical protein
MLRNVIVISFLLLFGVINAQDKIKKSVLIPNSLGILYNFTTEDNFLFNDPDYRYQAHVLKLQGFYSLRKWNNSGVELIVQPQLHKIQHQLINEQFVLPSESNYLEKRLEFTTPKTITLVGLEFAISFRQRLFSKLDAVFNGGAGIAHIDRRTERLAKGFTFIENLSLGLDYQILKKLSITTSMQFGHVSNFDIQQPNSGYSTMGFEIGIRSFLD